MEYFLVDAFVFLVFFEQGCQIDKLSRRGLLNTNQHFEQISINLGMLDRRADLAFFYERVLENFFPTYSIFLLEFKRPLNKILHICPNFTIVGKCDSLIHYCLLVDLNVASGPRRVAEDHLIKQQP